MNDPSADQSHEPIFNVPGAVLAVLAVICGLHAWRTLVLSPEADLNTVLALAFIPARLSGHASALPGGELATVTSFVTHMLLHVDTPHLLIIVVLLVLLTIYLRLKSPD